MVVLLVVLLLKEEIKEIDEAMTSSQPATFRKML
jgi:hypothetical protein